MPPHPSPSLLGLDQCDARTRPHGVPGVFRYYLPSPFANANDTTGHETNDENGAVVAAIAMSGGGDGQDRTDKSFESGVVDGNVDAINSLEAQGYVLCQTTVIDTNGDEETIPNAPGTTHHR